MTSMDDKLRNLAGPVLVLGASGFIGANLLRRLLAVRTDATGTVFSGDTWRLDGVPSTNVAFLNLQDPVSVTSVLRRVAPRTIFDCSSFGAYSFEWDHERIHATNYLSFIRMMEELAEMPLVAVVHAGSSSEYGLNSEAPSEDSVLTPNSHYAVSKAATSGAISYYGKVRGIPVTNLRLYSVYGPFEDSSRLIPALCEASLRQELPILAGPQVSRDFVHVDDVVEAFADTALRMSPDLIGESFNIGSGEPTTLAALAILAREHFGLKAEPRFNSAAGRAWDIDKWYADITKARRLIGWSPKVGLASGLERTREWWKEHLLSADFTRLRSAASHASRRTPFPPSSPATGTHRRSRSCTSDWRRFERLGVDYEIIFVNEQLSRQFRAR